MQIYTESELLSIKELLSYINDTNYDIILDIIALHLELHKNSIDISLKDVLKL